MLKVLERMKKKNFLCTRWKLLFAVDGNFFLREMDTSKERKKLLRSERKKLFFAKEIARIKVVRCERERGKKPEMPLEKIPVEKTQGKKIKWTTKSILSKNDDCTR